jgi:hypothetical protein
MSWAMVGRGLGAQGHTWVPANGPAGQGRGPHREHQLGQRQVLQHAIPRNLRNGRRQDRHSAIQRLGHNSLDDTMAIEGRAID